jgi:hypothetical protein
MPADAGARGSRRAVVVVAGCAVLGLAAAWLRLGQRHHGLLYPDGYQYLLMARGIAEHLRPTTTLGPGGDGFAPSFDAATKPLFAAIVAGPVALGAELRSAGSVVAAVSAGLASLAGALLVLRLTRSTVAAVACGAVMLASPTLGYWWGFAGPDGLAAALALLAAWLAARRSGAGAGVAAGLATATRPELVIVVLACIVGAGLSPDLRRTALRAGASAFATLALVYALVRPPLAWTSQLVVAPLAGVVGAALLVAAWRAGTTRRGAMAALAAVAGALVALAAAGRVSALTAVARDEWALVVAAALAGAALWPQAQGRRLLLTLVAVAGLLAAAYAFKNPSSERYVANLLPIVAVLIAAGLAAAGTRRRWPLATAIVALVAIDGALGGSPPAPGVDPFDDVAPQLAALAPGPVVSATPDAYGVLLPDRAQRLIHTGARGFVVLDAGQRYYAPGFAARGTILFRAVPFYGFVRPDGSVDRGATTVVEGVAVRATGRRLP